LLTGTGTTHPNGNTLIITGNRGSATNFFSTQANSGNNLVMVNAGDPISLANSNDEVIKASNTAGLIQLLAQVAFNGISNSTGLQLFNTTTTCTTAATINTPCTTAAITLPVAYADTNYRLQCQGLGPTNFPQLQTVTKSNTTFTITVNNLTAAAASYSSFDCSAVHK
jgi:hypothetical protein